MFLGRSYSEGGKDESVLHVDNNYVFEFGGFVNYLYELVQVDDTCYLRFMHTTLTCHLEGEVVS